MVEITDGKSAKEWLKEQDRQTNVWFACRCALRTLPALGDWSPATASGLALLTLRANLITAAAATCPPAKMIGLELQARTAAYNLNNAGCDIVHSDYAAVETSPIGTNTAFLSASSVATLVQQGDRHGQSGASAVIDLADILSETQKPYAYSAASLDANAPLEWGALWPNGTPPDGHQERWKSLKTQWADDPDAWSFWIEWYEGILAGTPLPMELTQKIALEITDAEWNAGPKVVAKRIAEIRKDFERTPLDQDALRSHVQQLAQSPVLHADVAESAGLQIDAAIQAFKAEAPANQLPYGFGAFEVLAPTFLSISTTLSVPAGVSPDTAALQAEINHLHNVIEQLRTDLRDARHRLSDVRLTAQEAQRIRTFGERLQTTLTNITLVGTIGMGAAWFCGVPAEELRYEALKSALQGLSLDMENVQPTPDAPALPETTGV